MTKKRVVAYCRVSTDDESQETSFENQQSYFRNYVSDNKDYEFAELDTNNSGIYADKGISGTKLSRPAFNQMLIDAGLERAVSQKSGKLLDTYEIVGQPKFDIILVKDVSRLARNMAIDSIVKTLAKNNVYVVFTLYKTTTENESGYSTLQIFYSIAEEESRTKSKNVRLAYEQGVKNGTIYVGGKVYGYDYKKKDKKDPDNTNKLIINEKQAQVVRLIFDLYTEEKMGHQQICNELARLGFRNTNGKKFTRSTIRRILTNPRYIGENVPYTYKGKDSLFSRPRDEAKIEELRKQAQAAAKELAQKNVKRIEPIIEREQFDKAQAILEENRKRYNNNCTYHGITPYARKIKCGLCDCYFTAQSSKNINGQRIRYYACTSRIKKDPKNSIYDCGNRSVTDEYLNEHLLSRQFYDSQIANYNEMIEDCKKAKALLKEARKMNYTEKLKELNELVKNQTEEFNRLKNLYRKGDYTEEEYDIESQELKEKLNKNLELQKLLNDPIKRINNYLNDIDGLISRIDEAIRIATEDMNSGRTLNRTIKEALNYVDTIYVYKDRLEIQYKTVSNMSDVNRYLDSITQQFIECLPKKQTKTMKKLVTEWQANGIDIHVGKKDNE